MEPSAVRLICLAALTVTDKQYKGMRASVYPGRRPGRRSSCRPSRRPAHVFFGCVQVAVHDFLSQTWSRIMDTGLMLMTGGVGMYWGVRDTLRLRALAKGLAPCYAPAPMGRGHYKLPSVVCPSVCLWRALT